MGRYSDEQYPSDGATFDHAMPPLDYPAPDTSNAFNVIAYFDNGAQRYISADGATELKTGYSGNPAKPGQ